MTSLLAPPEAPARSSVPAAPSFEFPPAPPTSLAEAMIVDDSEIVEVVQSSNTVDLTEEEDAQVASNPEEDSKIAEFCTVSGCETESARGYLEVRYSEEYIYTHISID